MVKLNTPATTEAHSRSANRAVRFAVSAVDDFDGRGKAIAEWLSREQPDVAMLYETRIMDRASISPMRAVMAVEGYALIQMALADGRHCVVMFRGNDWDVVRSFLITESRNHSDYLEMRWENNYIAFATLPPFERDGKREIDSKAWFESLVLYTEKMMDLDQPYMLILDPLLARSKLDFEHFLGWRNSPPVTPGGALYDKLVQCGWAPGGLYDAKRELETVTASVQGFHAAPSLMLNGAAQEWQTGEGIYGDWLFNTTGSPAWVDIEECD